MSEPTYPVTRLLVVYQEASPPQWLTRLYAKWPNLTPVRSHGADDAGNVLEQIKQFYGKSTLFREVPTRLDRVVKWLFQWLTKKPPNPKLGDPGNVVVIDRRVLPAKGYERFALLKRTQDDLSEYYVLLVLVTDTVEEDRREANRAGAFIVLDTNIAEPRTLEAQVFAFRAAEAASLQSRSRSRRNQLLAGALTVVAAAALRPLGSALLYVWQLCVEQYTNRLGCEVFLGQTENTSSATTVGTIWQEFCLRISNEGGGAKSHFVIQHDLGGLRVRNLPKTFPDRIDVGKSAEIRFQIELPKQLPDDFPLCRTKISVESEGMLPQSCPLAPLLLQSSLQTQRGATPCPRQ